MKKLLLLAMTGLPLALMPPAAPADVLVLTDGQRLEGRVEPVQNSNERVAFLNGRTGRLEFPLSRVSERVEESDAQDWTRLGQQFLELKNHSAAVQMFQRALEAEPGFNDAQEGLRQAQGAIDAQKAEQARAMQEKLGAELEAIPGLIEAEKFEEAEAILNRVLKAEISDQQRIAAQRQLRDLYLAWGFSRYDRLDRAGAEEKYLRVREMDPDNKEARERLLQIWQDDPTKKDEVLRAYHAKLQEEPNNLEYNRIVADMLYSTERWQEAIPMLKKVAAAPRYAGQGYDQRLRRAYQQAITSLRDANKLDQAILITEDMLQLYPNEDQTQLTVLRYEREKARLAKDDYTGWAVLAQRLSQAGLPHMAEREAQLILRYDPQNEQALQILRAAAEEQIAQMNELLRQQEYLVARDQAERFVRTETRFADLIERAQEIYNQADIEAKRTAKENRETARALAERGIEYYNEAMRNVTLMTDQTVRSDARPISYKQQAIRLTQRSIQHFETALRIDPTLGPITGMDLNARLLEARNLYDGLTDPARPMPRIRNRNPIRGQ